MQNFEQYTKDLNDQEKKVFEIIVRRFQNNPGKTKKVTNKGIISGLKKIGFDVKEPRIRKIIHHIRTSGALKGLIATSSGYWRTTDPKELKSWLDSLEDRERAIRNTREAGESDLREMLENR